jgi:hypothetical protein
MKTTRFTELVGIAGRPQVHPLWLAPDKDPALKRAVRDCRVMTIHQNLHGTKKDYGTVGLHLEGSTQVLVFPKSLRRFGDRHIVGIDYKLIVHPEPKDPAPPPKPKADKRATAARKPLLESAAEPTNRPGRTAQRKETRGAGASAGAERQPHPKAEAAAPLTREELLAEIRRAVRELKAGKAVAAYERLAAISDGK